MNVLHLKSDPNSVIMGKYILTSEAGHITNYTFIFGKKHIRLHSKQYQCNSAAGLYLITGCVVYVSSDNLQVIEWTTSSPASAVNAFLIYPLRSVFEIHFSAKPEQENLGELKQELDVDFHKVVFRHQSFFNYCQGLSSSVPVRMHFLRTNVFYQA